MIVTALCSWNVNIKSSHPFCGRHIIFHCYRFWWESHQTQDNCQILSVLYQLSDIDLCKKVSQNLTPQSFVRNQILGIVKAKLFFSKNRTSKEPRTDLVRSKSISAELEWFGCKAGHQRVIQVTRHASEPSTLDLKLREYPTRSSKQGYHLP